MIDDIVREGARRMLAAALQAEVAAYIAAHADQVDERGRRLVVRNGYAEPRQVLTSAGAVEVKAPRVNDKRTTEATGEGSHEMTRYLISFDDGAMIIPAEELPDVAEAAHKVVQEAKDAGVWVFGCGVESQRASIVATDGTVTAGPHPETKAVIGGFSVVEVPSREEALEWAAKLAVACRCAQKVREIGPDPNV